MSFKQDIYDYLVSKTNLTDEIGLRLFYGIAPTDVTLGQLPYITWNRLASPNVNHFNGASPQAHPTFQFDVWAKDSLVVEAAAEALRDVFDGLQRTTQGGTFIERVFLDSQRDDITTAEDGGQINHYRISMDFDIWYARSVPTL